MSNVEKSAASDNAVHVETDVLVIGSGASGMYAALEAARAGASVVLVDRSLIGRGGATVMAQMTVAAALGEQTSHRIIADWRVCSSRSSSFRALRSTGKSGSTSGRPVTQPGV